MMEEISQKTCIQLIRLVWQGSMGSWDSNRQNRWPKTNHILCACLGFQLLTLWDHPRMLGQSFCPFTWDEFELHWMSGVKQVSIKIPTGFSSLTKEFRAAVALHPTELDTNKDEVLCFHADISFLNKGKDKLCRVVFPKQTGRENASCFSP